jgi:hypothetical protein
VNDSADDKIEAGGSESLAVEGTVADVAQLVQEDSPLEAAKWGPPVDEERLYRVVDALEAVAADTGKSVPQIAIA